MNKKRSISIVIAFLLALSLGGFGLYLFMSTNSSNQQEEPDFNRKTIVVDGVEYFPRQDISTFLMMGIDKEGIVESSQSYRNERNADVVLLLIFDESNETYDVLCLNRDTMVEMNVLGVGGKKAGKVTQQLALAHTYGTGLEDSCENARETVSKLLNNIEIDNYISMNMNGIEIITDALGGVKVNVVDDFSQFDSSIQMGEQVLNGEQASQFVRVRKDMGDQLNSSRMLRQKEFLNGLENAFKEKKETDEVMLKNVYEQLTSYMVTDCSFSKLSTLADKYTHYTLGDIIIPEGEYVKGKKYLEFYLDEESFSKTIIDLLYAEKK